MGNRRTLDVSPLRQGSNVRERNEAGQGKSVTRGASRTGSSIQLCLQEDETTRDENLSEHAGPSPKRAETNAETRPPPSPCNEVKGNRRSSPRGHSKVRPLQHAEFSPPAGSGLADTKSR